jgi:hypothetical protein
MTSKAYPAFYNKHKTPIINHKDICAKIAPRGWAYTGFDDGYYLFQIGDYINGFKEMRCLEEDLTIKNLELMIKYGVTR